jgi:hypothetical protein
MENIWLYVLFCAILGSVASVGTQIHNLKKSMDIEFSKVHSLLAEIRDKLNK